MTFITSVEEIGFKRAQEEMALKLFQRGMSVEEIVSITELLIEQVKKIQSQQKV